MADNRLVVRTYRISDGELVASRLIAYCPDDFAWLTKQITWASNRGLIVEVFNRSDEAAADANATPA